MKNNQSSEKPSNLTATIKCPVNFIAMFFIDKYIHGLSDQGQIYSFYVYAPLENAYENKYNIPFAPDWPDYSRGVVLHYVPVPSGIPIVGVGFDGAMSTQDRRKDHIRPWEQSVFQGWPLYFMEQNPQLEHVDRPLEFWLAEKALGTPTVYYGDQADEDSTDIPGPFIGP